MAKIAYTGSSDFHVLAADDLSKAGVEGFKKTSFAKGKETEVDDAVAQALLADPELFGTFSVVEEEAKPATVKTSGEPAKKELPSK